MNRHALTVLEFARALEVVGGYASSALGVRAVRDRLPQSGRESLETEQARVFAMVAILRSETGWGMPPIPDCAQSLARLRVAGTLLAGSDMLAIGTLLRASRMAHEALGDTRHPIAALALLGGYREQLLAEKRLEEQVDRVIAEDGTVRDDASPALRRLRRDLRGADPWPVALCWTACKPSSPCCSPSTSAARESNTASRNSPRTGS